MEPKPDKKQNHFENADWLAQNNARLWSAIYDLKNITKRRGRGRPPTVAATKPTVAVKQNKKNKI